MLASLYDTILQALTYVVPFLAVLMTIVFVHELGHFLAGRWCGIPVKTFSLGFGRPLWGFDDRRGTRWQIAVIPLGGYVKFADTATPAADSVGGAGGAFHASAVWKRFIVVAAGPLANFVFAALVYTCLYLSLGHREFSSRIGAVAPDSPAARAGLRKGDLVTAVDGARVAYFREVQRIVETSPGKVLTFSVERGGERLALHVTPEVKERPSSLGTTLKTAEIGIRRFIPTKVGNVPADLPAAKAGIKVGDRITAVDGAGVDNYDDLVAIIVKSAEKRLLLSVERDGQTLQIPVTPINWQAKDEAGKTIWRGRLGIGAAQPEAQRMSVLDAGSAAMSETYFTIVQTMAGIRDLFTSKNAADQMGGPILMAEATAEVVQLGLEPMLMWMAMLSANLGLFNLLPVPVLDGGHLVFYAIEAIRRRPLSPAVHAMGYRLGIALILGLMVYINLSDLLRVGKRLL